MDTMEQVYDALSEALGAHENENHDGPVAAIHTLQIQRDAARRILQDIREDTQDAIDAGEIKKATVKFNGGRPVVLCHLCRRIVKYEVNPATVQPQLCPEGVGCGEGLQDLKDSVDGLIELFKGRK